jgi:hypothetical protein
MRRTLPERFDIEIGTGLGPLAGKIWRVGSIVAYCVTLTAPTMPGWIPEKTGAARDPTTPVSPVDTSAGGEFVGPRGVAFGYRALVVRFQGGRVRCGTR